MLSRLLLEDKKSWDQTCEDLNLKNFSLRVPTVNDITTLHTFNVELSELFTLVQYHFNKARRNKDAIERIIENVLKDYYKGSNEAARRAAGLQYAQKYPIPESIAHFFETETVNLFTLEDEINGYYYSLDAILKSLHHKASAKITNNSLLNIERSLLPS